MGQTINIQNIPDIISLTDLRYKTRLLLRKILDEEKPLILVKKNKKIALILPLPDDLEKERPKYALKIKPQPLGVPTKIKRSLIYDDYFQRKS